MFNDLFDTLNSRFFYTTDYGKPFSKETKEKHFKLFDEAEKYIKGLKIYDPREKIPKTKIKL